MAILLNIVKHQSTYKQNTKQHLHSCHSIVWLLIQCQLIMIRKLLKLHYFMSENNEKCVSRKIK